MATSAAPLLLTLCLCLLLDGCCSLLHTIFSSVPPLVRLARCQHPHVILHPAAITAEEPLRCCFLSLLPNSRNCSPLLLSSFSPLGASFFLFHGDSCQRCPVVSDSDSIDLAQSHLTFGVPVFFLLVRSVAVGFGPFARALALCPQPLSLAFTFAPSLLPGFACSLASLALPAFFSQIPLVSPFELPSL